MTIQQAKNKIDREINITLKKLHDTKDTNLKQYYLGYLAGLESAYAEMCEDK